MHPCLHLSTPLDESSQASVSPLYKLRPSSSPKFVGYEDYLKMLDDHFLQQPANRQLRHTFVLFGVGGVGKTQICLRFAEKISNKYVMIS